MRNIEQKTPIILGWPWAVAFWLLFMLAIYGVGRFVVAITDWDHLCLKFGIC